MQVEDAVRQRLAGSRLKFNAPRQRVVGRLLHERRPMTVDELRRAEPSVPASSMYRTLALLEQVGVVCRLLGLNGVARFELTEAVLGASSHHHHLICERCGVIEDIEVPARLEEELSRTSVSAATATGFTVGWHRLELVGRCPDCIRAAGRYPGPMPDLQPLGADHASIVLAFERDNRAYFARSISDRGDEWFEHFTDRYGETLQRQADGIDAYYLLLDDDGAVLGRFNLFDLDTDPGTATLGYRMAERAAGRGLATSTVIDLTRIAADRHGLSTVRAAVSDANVASQRVLVKAGFVDAGAVAAGDRSSHVGGRAGRWYRLDLGGGTPGPGKPVR